MINYLDLIDIYKTAHQTTAQCTLFSNAGGTYTKIDYMVNLKHISTHLKKVEIIWNSAFQTLVSIDINQDLTKCRFCISNSSQKILMVLGS